MGCYRSTYSVSKLDLQGEPVPRNGMIRATVITDNLVPENGA